MKQINRIQIVIRDSQRVQSELQLLDNLETTTASAIKAPHLHFSQIISRHPAAQVPSVPCPFVPAGFLARRLSFSNTVAGSGAWTGTGMVNVGVNREPGVTMLLVLPDEDVVETTSGFPRSFSPIFGKFFMIGAQ